MPPTQIYTLSLHDALPIYDVLTAAGTVDDGIAEEPVGGAVDDDARRAVESADAREPRCGIVCGDPAEDRKSTRLNSSHVRISYAVFCLKKKKNIETVSLEK